MLLAKALTVLWRTCHRHLHHAVDDALAKITNSPPPHKHLNHRQITTGDSSTTTALSSTLTTQFCKRCCPLCSTGTPVVAHTSHHHWSSLLQTGHCPNNVKVAQMQSNQHSPPIDVRPQRRLRYQTPPVPTRQPRGTVPPSFHLSDVTWFPAASDLYHYPSFFITGRIMFQGTNSVVLLAKDAYADKFVLKMIWRGRGSQRGTDPMNGLPVRFGETECRCQNQAIGGLDQTNNGSSQTRIVKLYGVFTYKGYEVLILEHMPNRDLFDLNKCWNRPRMKRKKIATIIYEIAMGLKQCHENGIVHGDVKPENIMVDADGRMKLGGFGWAFQIGREERNPYVDVDADDFVEEELGGTDEFRAPELWRWKNDKRYIGVEVDMWALGCVAYELLFGERAFKWDSARHWWNRPSYKKMPGGMRVDEEAIELVKGLLRRDRKKRFTLDCVLSHRWIVQHAER